MKEQFNQFVAMLVAKGKLFAARLKFTNFDGGEAVAALGMLTVFSVIASSAQWWVTAICIVVFSVVIGWIDS